MSIEGFDYQEQVLGTGDTAAYGFDFLITDPSQIHVYIQDTLGNIVADTHGDDTTVVASVAFNSANDGGGGTLTLVSDLSNNYTMTMLLANDAPDQPNIFSDLATLDLGMLESALDYLAAWGQRIAFLAQRAFRLHDLDDIDSVDVRFPIGFASNPGSFLSINSTGTALAYGPTLTTILDQAVAAAELAIIANQGGFLHVGYFAQIAPGSNLDLPSEAYSHTSYSQVDYIVRIQRGTYCYARQEFSIFYRNGAWEIAIGPDRFANAGNDHGVTFTVNSVTGQINAAVASDGEPNALIDLQKMLWTT